MLIRGEQDEDAPTVAAIVSAAFDDGGVVARLVEALRKLLIESQGCSLVAEVDGEIVGHVMFTPALLDAPRELVTVQVLSPLAVAPSHQRTGVGTQLVEAGLTEMREAGVSVVFLEGSPLYYGRFGFTPGGDQGFRKPSLRTPDAAFQALRLAAWEPWMTGTLVYPHAFWEADAVGLRPPDARG
ncbi:MAG TPA: N-acetyltransferase [Acidimicrobiales bacterium]|nr:N-acetyltransferase [Acidimicrobiales bacterium]